MKHITIPFIFTLLILVNSCKVNPFTGKNTLNMYNSNDQLFTMAFSQYDQFLNEHTVISNTKESQMITNVGQKLHMRPTNG